MSCHDSGPSRLVIWKVSPRAVLAGGGRSCIVVLGPRLSCPVDGAIYGIHTVVLLGTQPLGDTPSHGTSMCWIVLVCSSFGVRIIICLDECRSSIAPGDDCGVLPRYSLGIHSLPPIHYH